MRVTVFLYRKLGPRQGQINALGSLVYLQIDKSKQQFLADTGASVSFLPHKEHAVPSSPALVGANDKATPSWGSVQCCPTFPVPARGPKILSQHGSHTITIGDEVDLPPWSARQQQHLSFLAELTSDMRQVRQKWSLMRSPGCLLGPLLLLLKSQPSPYHLGQNSTPAIYPTSQYP